VQTGVAQGATPAQAAAGLTRAAGGLPPGRNPDWVPPGATEAEEPAQTLTLAPGVGRFPQAYAPRPPIWFPHLGAARELKRATEGTGRKVSLPDLLKTGADLRARHWRLQQDAGIDLIPSNDFSYYDRMLDTWRAGGRRAEALWLGGGPVDSTRTSRWRAACSRAGGTSRRWK